MYNIHVQDAASNQQTFILPEIAGTKPLVGVARLLSELNQSTLFGSNTSK
ncbi:hypothetical protein [Shimia litoralis]|nr:hypothetical protein [Shimia litoralis]